MILPVKAIREVTIIIKATQQGTDVEKYTLLIISKITANLILLKIRSAENGKKLIVTFFRSKIIKSTKALYYKKYSCFYSFNTYISLWAIFYYFLEA